MLRFGGIQPLKNLKIMKTLIILLFLACPCIGFSQAMHFSSSTSIPTASKKTIGEPLTSENTKMYKANVDSLFTTGGITSGTRTSGKLDSTAITTGGTTYNLNSKITTTGGAIIGGKIIGGIKVDGWIIGTVTGGTLIGGTTNGGVGLDPATVLTTTNGITTGGITTGSVTIAGATTGGTTIKGTTKGGTTFDPVSGGKTTGGTVTDGITTGGIVTGGAPVKGTDTSPATITGATITQGTTIGGTLTGGITKYYAHVLSTNFTIPLVRANFLSNKPQNATNSVVSASFLNSAGAGVNLSWGELDVTKDATNTVTSIDYYNHIGIQLGFLFSANSSSGSSTTQTGSSTITTTQSSAVFGAFAAVSVMNFQLGGGYEFGSLTPGQKRLFIALAYAIPVSALIDGGYKILKTSVLN
jgi:hypothetical protein